MVVGEIENRMIANTDQRTTALVKAGPCNGEVPYGINFLTL
jgi:hypothetical protein